MNFSLNRDSHIKEYLSTFEQIIIWGAGNLGAAIAEYLSNIDIRFIFWDQRFQAMPVLNGIKVYEPFSSDCNSDGTLVIFGISNGVIVPYLLPKLKKAKHVLMGVEIYQEAICPHAHNGKYQSGLCTDDICNIRTCDKLDRFMCPNGAELQLPVIGFVINQKCTLKCKHCSAFMTHYPEKQRINFPTERIFKDIDSVLGAVDSARQVTVYGGEPFLHPDIYKIIEKILTHKNFANLSINTNAVCKLDSKVLSIKDPRFNISISDYSENLSGTQLKKFNDNLTKIKNCGVKFRNTKPQWMIPSTFDDRKRSIPVMEKMTANCRNLTMCTEVKNGKFYPCAFICAIHALGKYDFESDYVDIDHACGDIQSLRKDLQHCLRRPYYRGCSICNSGLADNKISAGEQVV